VSGKIRLKVKTVEVMTVKPYARHTLKNTDTSLHSTKKLTTDSKRYNTQLTLKSNDSYSFKS